VLDGEVEGRFLCGIECDGVACYNFETARDGHRLCQQVLEGLGWTIHRVWPTGCFEDRNGWIERLVAQIEESRQRARQAETEEAVEAPVAVDVSRAESSAPAHTLGAVASVRVGRPTGFEPVLMEEVG
jgi:hypothetical protein